MNTFGIVNIAGIALLVLLLPTPSPAQDAPPRERLTPAEMDARVSAGPGAGSSGVKGIETVVLKGDPSKAGLYTILLRVPPRTTIQAHSHPDDRMATVVAGTWEFGYGKHFDEAALKVLPPGSFYTEPPHQPHFARTGDSAASIQISGFGPTATDYENPRDTPSPTP
jgi:quercetin dioxygenase-like cupin family protein